MTTMTPPTEVPAGQRVRSRWRLPLLVLGLPLALLLVAFAGLSLASWLGRDHGDVDRSWPTAYREVVVQTDGHVTIQAGPAGSVSLHSHQTWSWRRPETTTTVDAAGVFHLHVSCRDLPIGAGVCAIDTTLTVPAATHLRVQNGDGSVDVRGLSGPLDLHTGDGSVRGEALTSAVTTADTGDGSMHLTYATAPQSLSLHSGDGSVNVTVPRQAPDDAYHVVTHTGDGSTHIDVHEDSEAPRLMTLRTGDGSIHVQYAD